MILKPGELLHMPKGCYHAFRKAGNHPHKLKPDDCHYKLRSLLHDEIVAGDMEDGLCVSVACDWLFSGCSPEGMRREAMWSWTTCLRNRRLTGLKLCKEALKHPTVAIKSLAQTELALLFLASTSGGIDVVLKQALGPILVSLVKRQLQIIEHAETIEAVQKELFPNEKKLAKISDLVTVEKNAPDTIHSPGTPGCIDVASVDYECNYCGMELANSYFHCNVS
jgi:hypothetical protein